MSHPGRAILSRIRAAPADPQRLRLERVQCVEPRPPANSGLLELFVERAEDHRACVRRCRPESVGDTLAEVLGDRAAVVPDGFPWPLPQGVGESLDGGELERVDVFATTATLGMATTGAVVLTHVDGQRRPSQPPEAAQYVCVVRTDQVVPGVPEAIAALDPRWPQLWVAGPADHDIELDRIDEVHHPECLHVLLVDEAAA